MFSDVRTSYLATGFVGGLVCAAAYTLDGPFACAGETPVPVTAPMATPMIAPGVAPDASGRAETLRATLAARLPQTAIGGIDCDRLGGGLCEVQAGRSLFYTDPSGRFLVVGRVYDTETRSDLTAARLLELHPDAVLATAAAAEAAPGDAPSAVGPVASHRIVLDVAGLPPTGAVIWGPEDGPAVTVFSDLRCGYCRMLAEALTAVGARVTERPISVLGSRALAEAVVCARDPATALHAAYAGERLDRQAGCDVSGLDANEAFARTHGIAGTPVLVRGDGAVLHGYRPAAELRRWLGLEG